MPCVNLSINSAAKMKIEIKMKVLMVWFRWFLRHRWLWCHRFKPIMGSAVWGILPRVLLSSGQIAGYYNTVASSIAFTHLQNNSSFLYHNSEDFKWEWTMQRRAGRLLCVIPAGSMLVVCSEGVIQCFFMVQQENVVFVFPFWSIRQLHSKALQRKTFRCHFILQT